MKIKEKIINYFSKFMRLIIPKTEIEKQLDEIDKLKNNSDNYGRVAMMYYKLQNIHAMLIGRNCDDNWDFFLTDVYGKQYKMYRELYMKHKLKI